MQEQYSENTLLDVLSSLRKHLWGMVLIFVGIVLLVTIVTFVQTPTYEVGSSVMVKYGREYVYRSVDQVKKGDVQPLYSYNGLEVINTELEIFRSNELAGKVISSIGVDQLYADLAKRFQDKKQLFSQAVNRFRKHLKVAHIKASNVIAVTFQHKDPEVAVQVVDRLTDFFKERHLQLFKNPRSSFLEEQVALYRQQLNTTEDALRSFKQKNRIFSLKDQRKIFMQQYVNVNTLLIKGNSRLEELAERAGSLERQLATVPDTLVQLEDSTKEKNIDDANAELLKFKIHERDLVEKYPEDNRLVVAVRKDIKMVEKFIENQEESSLKNVRTGNNPVFQQLSKELIVAKADYAAQKVKNGAIQRQLDQLEKQLQQMTDQETKLNGLQMQVDTAETTYKNFVGKLEDSRIQDAMDRQKMVNVVVIEKPTVPVKPIKPNKKLNILVGIILGVACSLFYALFSEYVMVRKT